jgi:DNA-binding CsgD family transcriptional regulator
MKERFTGPAEGASSANPYGRTFVGREAELAQLRRAFDAASNGDGGVVMLSGEPGIGKTALARRFATSVADGGGRSLLGHCYEESSLSLPYLAFVEAIRAYVVTCDDERLQSDLQSGAGEVARIVPDLRERVPVELDEPGDPEEDRWRLQEAVTTFLRNAASAQPLVVVLEDLHWANAGTLDLLLHVARNLQNARVLVVGTCRDVEVPRDHPLHLALAELPRTGNFLRISLAGLTVDEVHRFYEAIRGRTVARSQAELVQERTEGNPLFVQEILRYLTEESIVALGPGEVLPAGLRDIVGHRLRRLGDQAHRAMSAASVIGRDFRLDVLQKVVAWPEEELFAALEEAQGRAIIEPRPAAGAMGFRFTHALFRETLYAEIFAPRRVGLHREVGRALEEIHALHPEEHAPELAEHFAQGREPVDLEKTVRYGEIAARRAMAVFDYGEAARHIEQSLRSLDLLDPGDAARRCDLLLLLGEAILFMGEREKLVAGVAPAALALAQRLSDNARAYAACKLSLDATMPVLQDARYWLDMAERYAGDDAFARIRLAKARAVDFLFQGRGREAKTLMLDALALARSNESPEWEFGTVWGVLGITDLAHEDRTRLVDEYHSRPRKGVTARNLSTALWTMTAAHLANGDREKAEELAAELEALSHETRESRASNEARAVRCVLAALDGRLEEADPRAFGLDWITWRIAIARWRGIELGPLTTGEGTPVDRILMAFHAAENDQPARAAALIPAIKEALPADFVRQAHVAWVSLLMELSLQVQDRQLCEHVYVSLRNRDLGTPLSNLVTRPQQRAMGDAAAFLGRHDEARRYYEEALAICDRMGHRPERAVASERLAKLLLGHYPQHRAAALAHLDFAIAEFAAMNMHPALERARALRAGIVGAAGIRASYPDGLSAREVEVLRLIAAGRSNAQIAGELVISLNTVQHHVSSILDKTATASRTEAAAYAHRHALV